MIDPKEAADEAIAYLLDVVQSRPTGRQAQHGVSAAKGILEHVRQSSDPLEQLIALLGDEHAVLDWMRSVMPKLELRAMMRGEVRALPEKT